MRTERVNADSPLLQGRIPYRMRVESNGALSFRWLYTGERLFAEPFFEETLAHLLSLPENSELPIPVTELMLCSNALHWQMR